MQFNYFLNKINNLDDFYKYINSWVFINYEEILQIILYIYAICIHILLRKYQYAVIFFIILIYLNCISLFPSADG